jgi:hypothetical protein
VHPRSQTGLLSGFLLKTPRAGHVRLFELDFLQLIPWACPRRLACALASVGLPAPPGPRPLPCLRPPPYASAACQEPRPPPDLIPTPVPQPRARDPLPELGPPLSISGSRRARRELRQARSRMRVCDARSPGGVVEPCLSPSSRCSWTTASRRAVTWSQGDDRRRLCGRQGGCVA